MRFYQHKTTGLLVASFHELLDPIDENGKMTGGCYTRVILPSKTLGNGIIFHIMHYREFRNFKRISKEKFFELCPDFGQLRHWMDDTIERKKHIKLFENSDYEIKKRKITMGNNNPNEKTHENTNGALTYN